MESAPFDALTPKEETRAAAFLRAHPNFDGRGVVVAVLDTGIDPGAAGLLVCPDGRPKLVDMVDATGSGDVDMRTLRTGTIDLPDGGKAVQGITGRLVRINASWRNPSGQWRVGAKRAYDVFPGPLVLRIKAERGKARKRATADMAAQLNR